MDRKPQGVSRVSAARSRRLHTPSESEVALQRGEWETLSHSITLTTDANDSLYQLLSSGTSYDLLPPFPHDQQHTSGHIVC